MKQAIHVLLIAAICFYLGIRVGVHLKDRPRFVRSSNSPLVDIDVEIQAGGWELQLGETERGQHSNMIVLKKDGKKVYQEADDLKETFAPGWNHDRAERCVVELFKYGMWSEDHGGQEKCEF